MEDGSQVVDLAVSGAVVTATNFHDTTRNFWLQDANGAVQVFLPMPTETNVTVGDLISFTVTEMSNFEGHMQISAISDFMIDSSGNAVPYLEKTGTALTADDYNKVVRIAGTITGPGTECGGQSKCYPFKSGDHTVIHRTGSQLTEVGDCVTFVGPVSSFPGPDNDTGAAVDLQLDAKNFDWVHTLFD